MASSPRALVLTGFGINCEDETAHALRLGGASTELIHFNQLASKSGAQLEEFQMLAFPGGFAFGDDIQSGRVLANKFKYKLNDPLKKFVDAGKPIIGICNGFQVLVQLGVLPGFGNWERKMTLARNASGKFEDRWVRLRTEDSACPYARHLGTLSMPARHGEGQMVFSSVKDLEQMKEGSQIVFRYADAEGNAANTYPLNPNGSMESIAGVCNSSGNVLGLMPHPECHVRYTQSPDWTSNPPLGVQNVPDGGLLSKLTSVLGISRMPKLLEPADEGNCKALFTNLVEHARKF